MMYLNFKANWKALINRPFLYKNYNKGRQGKKLISKIKLKINRKK